MAELARALGLSRTTIQSRLSRLERTGVIAGYSVRLAEARGAAPIHAHVLLTVGPKHAGAVTTGGVILSFVIGAALMASPIVLLHVKGRPYFRQS